MPFRDQLVALQAQLAALKSRTSKVAATALPTQLREWAPSDAGRCPFCGVVRGHHYNSKTGATKCPGDTCPHQDSDHLHWQCRTCAHTWMSHIYANREQKWKIRLTQIAAGGTGAGLFALLDWWLS